jgi:integrase
MKGHIEQRECKKKLPRGHSCWNILIETGRAPSGRRGRKRYTFFGTKTDAESELTKRLHQLETGALVLNDAFTVSDYLDHWLSAYAKPSTAPRTYVRYEQLVNDHLAPGLGNHKLTKLTPLHVQSFYASMLKEGRCDGSGGLSPQSVVHLHRVLHKALKQALLWGFVTRNVADAVSPPKVERTEAKALDKKQVLALLRHLKGTHMYLPVLLALHTGMRSGEILGLRWSEVDLAAGALNVGNTLQSVKGNLIMREPKSFAGRRRIPLTAETIEALKEHSAAQADYIATHSDYSTEGLVICRADGSPWHPSTFSAAWIRARKTAGVTVRFHELRHTHASLLLSSGAHPKALQERLGHSSAAFTMNVYAHLLPGVQEEAVANFEAMMNRAENEPKKQVG